MTKRTIFLLVPFLIATGTIIRCWVEIYTSNLNAQWQHYSAIICISAVVLFWLKGFIHGVISLGVFLILGTFTAFSMTSIIETSQIGIAGHLTPPFNTLALGILLIYLILNSSVLINLYLDRKEKKAAIKSINSNKKSDLKTDKA